jgi:hypothetical protein
MFISAVAMSMVAESVGFIGLGIMGKASTATSSAIEKIIAMMLTTHL